MITSDQSRALVSMVNAATEAVAALGGAKCFCHGDFVCTRHKAESELTGAVELVERAFTGERLPPNVPCFWSSLQGGWARFYHPKTPVSAQEYAQRMARAFPENRWAWTDENGNLHEVTREEAK